MIKKLNGVFSPSPREKWNTIAAVISAAHPRAASTTSHGLMRVADGKKIPSPPREIEDGGGVQDDRRLLSHPRHLRRKLRDRRRQLPDARAGEGERQQALDDPEADVQHLRGVAGGVTLYACSGHCRGPRCGNTSRFRAGGHRMPRRGRAMPRRRPSACTSSGDREKTTSMTNDPSLQALNQLVGTWSTEATHPAMPGIVVHGTADRMAGGRTIPDQSRAHRSSGLPRCDLHHRVHRSGSRKRRNTAGQPDRRRQSAVHALLRFAWRVSPVRGEHRPAGVAVLAAGSGVLAAVHGHLFRRRPHHRRPGGAMPARPENY